MSCFNSVIKSVWIMLLNNAEETRVKKAHLKYPLDKIG